MEETKSHPVMYLCDDDIHLIFSDKPKKKAVSESEPEDDLAEDLAEIERELVQMKIEETKPVVEEEEKPEKIAEKKDKKVESISLF